MLKRPDCGTVFAAPAMDMKRSGIGWTLPYMGNVRCPKCEESRSRRDYQKPPTAAKAGEQAVQQRVSELKQKLAEFKPAGWSPAVSGA